MRRPAWLLPGLGLLALGVCFLAVARALDKGDEAEDMKAAAAAAPDVQKLADAAAAGDAAALKKLGDDAAKKYELKAIMFAFKPKEKGGLGVGATPDGAELTLIKLGKKALPATALTAQSADLQRMAALVRGISEVTPDFAGKFTKTGADAKVWDGLAEDMTKGAEDLSRRPQVQRRQGRADGR